MPEPPPEALSVENANHSSHHLKISAQIAFFRPISDIYMKVLLWLICTISYDNMRFIPLSEFKSSEECERSKIEFVKKGYVAENLICAEPK